MNLQAPWEILEIPRGAGPQGGYLSFLRVRNLSTLLSTWEILGKHVSDLPAGQKATGPQQQPMVYRSGFYMIVLRY